MSLFLTIFLLSSAIISIALIGLGIQTFFSKKRKLPETKVGHNKENPQLVTIIFQTCTKLYINIITI